MFCLGGGSAVELCLGLCEPLYIVQSSFVLYVWVMFFLKKDAQVGNILGSYIYKSAS